MDENIDIGNKEAVRSEPSLDAETRSWFERAHQAVDWLKAELWADRPDASRIHHALQSTAQLIVLTARGVESDQILLRASALTYVTALSVIPMLGVTIAILGVMGGDETLVEFAIDQLTTVAPEVHDTVREYASQLNFARFGTIGGTIVFGTAIFALRHLEGTLNDIWGVPSSRTWARRFSDYLAVMVVAPVSTGVAVSLATTLQSNQMVTWLLEYPVFSQIYGVGLAQVPVLVLFMGFTFLFWFFPNTKVPVRAAALGGAVAAILFSAARTIYVDFQVGAATYQAVFGALSAVPLILAWLYACWAVLLLGAEVAFATQNLPYARREMRSGATTMAEREAIALEISAVIATCFMHAEAPPNAERLADVLEEPVRLIRRICETLEEANLVRPVVREEERDPAYLPAGPLASITVGQVLDAVRCAPERAEGTARAKGAPKQRTPSVAAAVKRLDQARRGIAETTTLADLALEAPFQAAHSA